MKAKSDYRSNFFLFSNLINWKEEAWKISGLQRDSNPWPLRYQCDARPTELWSHTFGERSICWVDILKCIYRSTIWISYLFHLISLHGKISTKQFGLAPNVWLYSSVGRVSHQFRGGHGFESRWSPDIFQASSFQLLKLENLLRLLLFTFCSCSIVSVAFKK